MNKIIDFSDNDYILTINGNDYAVAKRTGELEKKLREHDVQIGTLSEYESNKELIELLLGKKAFKEIFPNGEKENLDKIAKVAFYAVKYFNAAKTELDKQQIADKVEALKDVAADLGDVSKVAQIYEHINK